MNGELSYGNIGNKKVAAPDKSSIYCFYSYNISSNFSELIDIDTIKEITVVQYNQNHDKINEDEIIRDKGYKRTYILKQETVDFKVIMNYYNNEEKDLQERTLFSKDDILDNEDHSFKKIYKGFDEEGNFKIYHIEFVVE